MIKTLDWKTLKPYLTGQALKDLDRFLDALPKRAGMNAVVAAGLMWLVAGMAILFAATETKKVSELRTEMLATEALMPPVPGLKEIPVPAAELQDMADKIREYYAGVDAKAGGPGKISLTAPTNRYPLFRTAIGHIQSGGKSWKVRVHELCTGRDCKGAGLQATLNVSIIRVMSADEAQPKGQGGIAQPGTK